MDKNFSIKTIKEDYIFVAIDISAKRKHSLRDLFVNVCQFVAGEKWPETSANSD